MNDIKFLQQVQVGEDVIMGDADQTRKLGQYADDFIHFFLPQNLQFIILVHHRKRLNKKCGLAL